jgi:Tol biopolymer transport system component
MRTKHMTLLATAAALLVTALLPAGSLAAGKTSLVSRQSAAIGGLGADDESGSPSVSANGRFVAFSTGADNLGGPLDGAAAVNIYVYDRRERKAELVSRQSESAGGEGADDSSFAPSISADGRYVAFTTRANNLGGPIEPSVQNVYVYDRARGRIRLVSRQSASAGGAGAFGGSSEPAISADGRRVAFETTADNLGGPLDGGASENIYVYDLARKRVQLVSRQSASAGGTGGDRLSERPSISGDGRVIAFQSRAGNLGGPTVGLDRIYAYDTERKRVRLVSRQSAAAGGAAADDVSISPAISADGRFVVYRTSALNLGGPVGNSEPIYRYDLKKRRTLLVSRQSAAAGGGGANGSAANPVISQSGRFVAFQSTATNLAGSLMALNNVYCYDVERRRVRLVSRQSALAGGQAADGNSSNAAISADGRVLAFGTFAGNLGGPQLATQSVYARSR